MVERDRCGEKCAKRVCDNSSCVKKSITKVDVYLLVVFVTVVASTASYSFFSAVVAVVDVVIVECVVVVIIVVYLSLPSRNK